MEQIHKSYKTFPRERTGPMKFVAQCNLKSNNIKSIIYSATYAISLLIL